MTNKKSKIEFKKDSDRVYRTELDGMNLNMTELHSNSFNLLTRNPEEFASKLFSHIQSIDDELLTSIFTNEFLQELVFSNLWILPNISLNEYENLSRENIKSKPLNQLIIDELILPKIIEIQNNWNISNKNQNCLNNIMENFYDENYNITIIKSLFFVNGINGFETFHKNIENIQKRLEYKLKNNMTNFEIFKIKSFQSFLEWILKPLYYETAVIKDESEKDLVQDSESIDIKFKAIRMIMVIDTFINIFKIIEEEL